MMYTMMAIVLILISMSVFFLSSKYVLRERSLALESRILSTNDFINDLERDLERALYIASFRGLLGMTEYMAQNATYITNMTHNFQDLVINGTIYGNRMKTTNDSYVMLWLQKIDLKARGVGLAVDASDFNIGLRQENPWKITVELNLTLEITDLTGLASWQKADRIVTQIPVVGLEDPLYVIGSTGIISNRITRTPYTLFVNASNSNVSNLLGHVQSSYYINSSNAPDYLMRMQGQLGASANGIESLVDSSSLIVLGLYENKSIVDYLYWSGSDPPHYGVQGMPNWFRLDNQSNRLGLYQVDGLETN